MNAPADKIRYGKYWLLRRLAKGGMAELFLAYPAAAGKENERLVIKRLLPQYLEEEEFLHMFLDEARLASQLAHPGIVRIFDLGIEQGHLYIAMEYIEGQDLESVARARKKMMAPAMAARIAAETCGALAYAHAATDVLGKPLGIVHRDVTPENVMITKRGEVKLVDFGVAKATSKLGMTRPGVVKGKLSYMAPEHILGKDLDGRADLFSLGAALYEVTTAIKPFERGQMQETVGAIINEHPQPPDRIIKGYPPMLSAIVMKSLEKDRDKRFANAKEMKQELERFLAQAGQPILPADIAALLTPPAGQPSAPSQAPPPRPGPPPLPPAASLEETTNPSSALPPTRALRPSAPGTPATGSPPKRVAPPAPPPGSPPRRISQQGIPIAPEAPTGSPPRRISHQAIPAATQAPAGSPPRRISQQAIPAASANRISQPIPAARPQTGSPPKQVPPVSKALPRHASYEEDLPEPETQVGSNPMQMLAQAEAALARGEARPPPPPPNSEENVVPLQAAEPPPPPPDLTPPQPRHAVAVAPPPAPSLDLELSDADVAPTRELSADSIMGGETLPPLPPPSRAPVPPTRSPAPAKAPPRAPAPAPVPAHPPISPDEFAPSTGEFRLGDDKSATVSHGQKHAAEDLAPSSVVWTMLKGFGVFGAVLAAGYIGHVVTVRDMEGRMQKLEARLAQPPPVAAAGLDASVAGDTAPDAGASPAAAAHDAATQAPPDAAAAPEPDAGATKNAPAIISVTGEGSVTIDDKRCESPCASQVEPGEHVVRLIGSRKKFEKKVKLEAGQTERIKLP